MSPRKLTLALVLGSSLAQAADAPAYATPQTPDAWLERMTDFTKNASAYKDPKVFMPWLNAVTEPSFYVAAGQGMMDPQGWIKMMNSSMQPGVVTNYGAFADPTLYLKWLNWGVDPNTYVQLMNMFADPGKMMRWAMVPLDPKLWKLMMTPLDPNLYLKWMMAPLSPQAMQTATMPLNPNVYMGWMANMINPSTYYPAFNTVVQAGAQDYARAASLPQGNLFDPMSMFGFTVPQIAPPTVTAPAASSAPVVAAEPAAVPPPAAAPAPAAPAKTILGADALFPSGRSSLKDISDEGKAKLDELAAGIKASGGVDVIKITGHADKSGNTKANQSLSLNRAKAVKDYLVGKGVNTKAFQTVGAGDTQPVKECDMKLPSEELKACLAPNRRVEVDVVVTAK